MKFRTILAILFLLSICTAATLDTYHSGWQLVRETANEDGATFAAVYSLVANQGNFASKDSNSVLTGGPFQIPARVSSGGMGLKASQGDTWQFVISGENFNVLDDTFSYSLVGWAKDNGMMQTICDGTGVLGTQAVVAYPDGGDALGAFITVSDANYTHSTTTIVDSTDTGSFSGAVAGMQAYVTGTNITSGYYAITTVTDANTLVLSGITSTDDNEELTTVQINPAFWADTLTITDANKWPDVTVGNSGNNQVATLTAKLKGLEWIQFVIYGADAATGEEAGNVTVYGRNW